MINSGHLFLFTWFIYTTKSIYKIMFWAANVVQSYVLHIHLELQQKDYLLFSPCRIKGLCFFAWDFSCMKQIMFLLGYHSWQSTGGWVWPTVHDKTTYFLWAGGFGNYLFGMSSKIASQAAEANDSDNIKDPSLGWMIGYMFIIGFLGLFSLVPLRKVSQHLSNQTLNSLQVLQVWMLGCR